MSNLDFDAVKKLLQDNTNGYYPNYIRRQLHENTNLRRVYLAVVLNSPARISEITDFSLLTRTTCYSLLHKLLELKLLKRIFVIDVMEGKIAHTEIKRKFEDWTSKMDSKLKRYYLAKTSYWEITDFGKEFAGDSYTFDQEFRDKNKQKESEKENE